MLLDEFGMECDGRETEGGKKRDDTTNSIDGVEKNECTTRVSQKKIV